MVPHRRRRGGELYGADVLAQAADGRARSGGPEAPRSQARRFGLNLVLKRCGPGASQISIPPLGTLPTQKMDAGHEIPTAARKAGRSLSNVAAPDKGPTPPVRIAGAPVESAPPATPRATSLADGVALAVSALRFSYPWLTAALLVGGLWGAAAYANPWRGRPAELWLAAAWLCGAACLAAATPPKGSRLRTVALCALVLFGAAVALLAVWQIPSLFS